MAEAWADLDGLKVWFFRWGDEMQRTFRELTSRGSYRLSCGIYTQARYQAFHPSGETSTLCPGPQGQNIM